MRRVEEEDLTVDYRELLCERIYRVIVQELGAEQRDHLHVVQFDLHVQVAGLPLIVDRPGRRGGQRDGDATSRDNEEAA